MVDMFWTYIRVYFIFDSYLLQFTVSYLILVFYQSVPHVIVETLSCFTHFLLIVLLMNTVHFPNSP